MKPRLILLIVMSLAYGDQLTGIEWARLRDNLQTDLAATPEADVVFVRYEFGHTINQEWVYNRADIDTASVIWATTTACWTLLR